MRRMNCPSRQRHGRFCVQITQCGAMRGRTHLNTFSDVVAKPVKATHGKTSSTCFSSFYQYDSSCHVTHCLICDSLRVLPSFPQRLRVGSLPTLEDRGVVAEVLICVLQWSVAPHKTPIHRRTCEKLVD